MHWFQLPQCQSLLVFLVLCESELIIFGFYTVSQTKQAILNGLFWVLGNCDGHFHVFRHVKDRLIDQELEKIIRLLDKENASCSPSVSPSFCHLLKVFTHILTSQECLVGNEGGIFS